MTNNLEVDIAPFCPEAVKDNENAVTCYTGYILAFNGVF